MGQYSLDGECLKTVRDDFCKKHSSILHMVASENHVYVLYNDKSLEVLKADAIDQVVAKTT